MLIRPARPGDLAPPLALLSALNLPTEGVREHFAGFLVAEDGGALTGLAGLEVHGQHGLLRSVAVSPAVRSQGVGVALVDAVLAQARAAGLSDLYLLTTTAQTYFPRLGFRAVPRSAAPPALLASREFQGACPASATLMHLSLEEKPMTQTIPGLGNATSTQSVLDALRASPQVPLEFWHGGAPLVGPGYHVTEVKAVTVEAMDCGGRASAWRETVIQLMDGTAEEARAGHMTTPKFLAIYDRVARHVPTRPEAEVRFEYGNAAQPAMQYHVSHVEFQAARVLVHLRAPGVQCKASDTSGQPASGTASAGGCTPEVGCCAPTAPDLMTLA